MKGGEKMGKLKPLNKDVRIIAAITSDMHMDTNSNQNSRRMKTVKKVLTDLEKSPIAFDAFIVNGDITSRGNKENWECVRKCFWRMHPAKRILLSMGNHDTWNDEGFKAALERFLDNTKNLSSENRKRAYFTEIIHGYYFIFLGGTKDGHDEDCVHLGREELKWFREQMEEASRGGKPIFVFCHQSINGHHGLPKTWSEHEDPSRGKEIGGIGSESDDVEKILTDYRNVFYFSGHSHMGLCGEKSLKHKGYASFEKHDGVNYINTPCLTRPNHHGETDETGIGMVLEIYSDRVVIRPRNFVKRKMNKKIMIRDKKPYYEEPIVVRTADKADEAPAEA